MWFCCMLAATRFGAEMSTCAAAQSSQVQIDSTIYHPSRACSSQGDGGLLCGIPVGYAGTGRTGVYYLPKVNTYYSSMFFYQKVLHCAACCAASQWVTAAPAVPTSFTCHR